MATTLASKALLATIRIGAWTGQKYDKEQTANIAAENNANKEAGRYFKHLINKKYLKPINSLNTALRAVHAELTLPWNNTQRLLPVDVFEDYKQRMEELKDQIEKEKAQLRDQYEAAIDEAQTRMGDMFNREEYPDVDELLSKFYVDIEFDQIPSTDHFVADVGEEEREILKAQIEEQTQSKIKGTMTDLYTRFKDMIELTKKNIENEAFSTPLIQNIDKLVGLVPNLNITGDTEILAMTSELQNSLLDVDPEELRPKHKKFDPEAHKRVKETVEDLSERLAGFLG